MLLVFGIMSWSSTHLLDAGVALQSRDGFIEVADHCRMLHADHVQGRYPVEGGGPRLAMCLHDDGDANTGRSGERM